MIFLFVCGYMNLIIWLFLLAVFVLIIERRNVFI